MAELLRNSRYQHTYDQVERMVKAENTDVHLETMEITENKGKEPDETRNARRESVSKRKYPKGVLGCCRKRNFTSHHNKRKTCTQGIL